MDKNIKRSLIDNWTNEKKLLSDDFIDNHNSYKIKKFKKGEVYYCDLGENIGSEQNKCRPVLVLTKDWLNDKSSTILIAPLSTEVVTKEIKKNGRVRIVAKYSTQYWLKKSYHQFLSDDSVVMMEQMKVVSKNRIKNKIGVLNIETLNQIDKKIKEMFDLNC